MKLKACLALCALFLSSLVFAQQNQQQQQIPPEQRAAMEAMAKAATPGDAHKKLATFVGNWDATVKSWMQPGAEPIVSHGTATNKSIFGGRFIQQDFSGDFMGQPFTGIGYWGYDNIKKQYVATWMDSMGTSMMNMTGTSDAPNQYTLKGSVADPMSGKDTPLEERWTVSDKDHHSFEMWGPTPDGKMYKMMEISYSRRKS